MRRSGRNPGFSLIEAIIAIVILSIAVPSMILAIRTSHDKRITPVLSSRANWLAAEKIEDVIADRNSDTRGFAYLTSANYPDESSVPGFPNFSRSVSLTQTAPDLATAGAGYMKVTVTVAWSEGGGVTRSLALSTVLTDYAQ